MSPIVVKRRGRPSALPAGEPLAGARARIHREEPGPLWLQVRRRIADAIDGGLAATDARMPSEQALSALFGVSRPVVRAALGSLAAEGRLIRIARRGTFVARPPTTDVDFITANLSVFDDLARRGHVVTTRTFRFERQPASATEQRMLQLPPGSEVVRIERLYASDGAPLTLTQISLPAHKVPGLETLALENQSILGTIRQRYGLTLQHSERWFRAVAASPRQAELLAIPDGSPIIAIESVAACQDGSPLEYYEAVFNSQAARIHLRADGGNIVSAEP